MPESVGLRRDLAEQLLVPTAEQFDLQQRARPVFSPGRKLGQLTFCGTPLAQDIANREDARWLLGRAVDLPESRSKSRVVRFDRVGHANRGPVGASQTGGSDPWLGAPGFPLFL